MSYDEDRNAYGNKSYKASHCRDEFIPSTDRILPRDTDCAGLPGTAYVVKDSGERKTFASGMTRDTSAGKTDISLVFEGPMLERWAALLTKAEKKYPDVAPGVPNWTLARGEEELQRARKSAARHFYAWMRGETDEDHAAALYFNLNLVEYIKTRKLHPLEEEIASMQGVPGMVYPPGTIVGHCINAKVR